MRPYRLYLALAISIAITSSCNQKKTAAQQFSISDSIAAVQEEQIPSCIYITEKGEKLEGAVLELSNGKKYYAVSIGACNYQQAIRAQKDGWVLPCALGVFVYDEHRYTGMPTWDSLLGDTRIKNNQDYEADYSTPQTLKKKDIKTYFDNNMDKGIATCWSTTRFPNKNQLANYVLEYNKDSGKYNFGLAEYDKKCNAFLLKDIELVKNQVKDNEYLTSKGEKIPAEKVVGGDGYDYWVVTPASVDSSYTWYEAMSLEKDGWVLPHTEGRYYPSNALPAYQRKLEHETIHSYSNEPTIEGIAARHPMVNADSFNRDFASVFSPSKYWLGTTMTKYPYVFRTTGFAGITYDERDFHNKVRLVKRIPPANPQIFYENEEGQIVQPKCVKGKSGKNYYVVDPSNWKNFRYNNYEAENFEESNGWHLLNQKEISDMLGTEVAFNTHLEGFTHPLASSLFNYDYCYFMSNDEGVGVFRLYIRHYAQVEYGLNAGKTPPIGGTIIRLVKTTK